MSVKINMLETTFVTTPNGITKSISDNSTAAATTAFVKSFISTYLIPLANTISLASTIAFSTIYVNTLRGVSSLTLRGNLSIGGSSTTVRMLGNIVNIDANYPYILSSPNQYGQKVQAGYRSFPNQGTHPIVTPIAPTGTSSAFASATIDASIGVTPTNTTGFNIRAGSTPNEVHWIIFQT